MARHEFDSALSCAGEPVDATLPELPELPRLSRLRDALLAANYGLCTQKAELMTEAMRREAPLPRITRALAPLHFAGLRRSLEAQLSGAGPTARWQLWLSRSLQQLWRHLDAAQHPPLPPLILAYARALAHTLAHAACIVYPDELLVGSPTRHRIGAALHPDYGGMLMLPELDLLAHREVNPLRTHPAQLAHLRRSVFPFWFTRSVLARAPAAAEQLELPNQLTEGRRFVLTQFAGISHVTPDFPRVLELGFEGIRGELRRAAASACDQGARDFYAAGDLAATAVIDFAARWSERCRREAARLETRNRARAAELAELARILEQVPARPARSFHEALQSVLTTWVAIHQESFQHGVSFGRVDQYLWPYYRRDREAGRLDPARAVELIGCLLAKAAEQLPLFNRMATEFFSGLSSASGLTLGGSDGEGNDASNELSYLFLRATQRMRLRQPNLHLRVHEDTPASLRALAVEVIGEGGGQPALFNEAPIIAALEGAGLPPEQARDFAIVGCVEWGVPYASFPAAGAGFVSLPAALLEALDDPKLRREPGLCGAPSIPDPSSPAPAHPGPASPTTAGETHPGMERIFAGFRRRLAAVLGEVVAGNNAIERAHAEARPTPLLSLLVDGCIDAGRDVTAGGARFNSTGIQGVGLADCADSLAAIEAFVIDQGRIGFAELMDAVTGDFVEHEPLRRRIVELAPKFGQGRGRPEFWARRVAQCFATELRRHQNPRGGPYLPGFWSMTTHIGFGARLGALPSGRRAGRPLANGASPCDGADSRGPTAALLAAAELGASPQLANGLANGLALNISLDPQFARGPRGAAIVDALTRGYFAAGGMQVQYNVVDVEQLIDAKHHPERHRGLVVRISGYSAYFNDLTPAMKDELIARTQHGRRDCARSTLGGQP